MQAGEAAWGPATQGHARDLVRPKGHRRFSAGEQQDEIKCVRKHQLLGRQWTEEREELAARTHGKTEKMRWKWQKEGGNDALETNSRGASKYYGRQNTEQASCHSKNKRQINYNIASVTGEGINSMKATNNCSKSGLNIIFILTASDTWPDEIPCAC